MVPTPTRNRVSNQNGVYVNGVNGTSSPGQSANRRQSLRENPAQAAPDSRAEHGTVNSSSRRSSTLSVHAGGPAAFTSTPENSGASNTTVARNTNAAIQAFLAAGPVTVSMTAERERPNPNPGHPTFLHGLDITATGPEDWYEVVLPAIRSFTFAVLSTTDLHYAADMFASSQLPNMFTSVTKINFPKLFWFSGVAHNRRHNPYFQMTASLPALEEICFTLHTAGITTSCFSERQMLQLEVTEPLRAKERKVMRLPDLVQKYEINGLFACQRVKYIRIEYIDCETTAFFTKVGSVVGVLREVQTYLVNGFVQHGLNVLVELVRVG